MRLCLLRLNLVNTITSACGALTGILLIDHVGRRPLMLFSSTACMANMAIITGLLCDVDAGNKTRNNAGIAWICETTSDTTDPSHVHGNVLGLLDADDGGVSDRVSEIREQSQGSGLLANDPSWWVKLSL